MQKQQGDNRVRRTPLGAALALALAVAVPAVTMAPQAMAQTGSETPSQRFSLPSQPLGTSLNQLAIQSRQQILVPPELVQGRTAPALSGEFTVEQALDRLLQGSGLGHRRDANGVISIIRADARSAPDAATRGGRTPAKPDASVTNMPEILVQGSRSLNMDIRRSIDDPQPYVVFDAVTIENSGAVTVEDFLRKRLTMITPGGSWAQLGYVGGDASTVNLRGLGEGKTLILVDGRRLARTSAGYGSGQADINAIPLGAIERIEVLPTTASAIYGGAAMGGVINIILKRGYTGGQLRLSWDDSFDTDSGMARIDYSQGFTFNEGRTSVNFNVGKSTRNDLLMRDRKFLERARERNPDELMFGYYPPIGTTANIRSVDGSELVLDDGTPLGSDYTHAPDGYAGVASDGGRAFVGNAGRYNMAISDSGTLYGNRWKLVPENRREVLSASIAHQFNDRLNAYLDASMESNKTWSSVGQYGFFDIPADSPVNPFQQDIVINVPLAEGDGTLYSYTRNRKFGAGFVYALGGGWTSAFDYTFSQSELGYIGDNLSVSRLLPDAISSGAVDLTRDPRLGPYGLSLYSDNWKTGYGVIGEPVKSIARVPSVRVSGPVATLPGGPLNLSMLLERTDLSYGQGGQGVPHVITIFPERSQVTDSAYAELSIPLVSSQNAKPWARELTLQVAARHDRFHARNAGHAAWYYDGPLPEFEYAERKINQTSPLVAMKWQANDWFMLRASVSDGFLTPDVDQLGNPSQYMLFAGSLRDPRRGYTAPQQEFLYSQGANPNLGPETSRSWSAGLVLTPFEGTRFSVDYNRIRRKDVITGLSGQLLLDNEDYFPGRIVRGERLPTDPPDWAGPILEFDASYLNAASQEIETWDFKFDWRGALGRWGELDLYAGATLTTRVDLQIAPTLPAEDRLGWQYTSAGIPIKWRANFGADWRHGDWGAGWNANFYDSFYVADPDSISSQETLRLQGNGGKVPNQIYHDVYVRYAFPMEGEGVRMPAIFADSEITFGIRNVLGKTPPFQYSNSVGHYAYFGDPRLMTYYITWTKQF